MSCYHRDLHVLPHSFPTRRSSDLTGIPAFKWDVSDFAACQAGVARIEAEVGPIDILVNNAGITRDGTIHKMDHDMWQAVIDTNLGSCFRSEEHTSELQSLMRISYAVFCLKKKM